MPISLVVTLAITIAVVMVIIFAALGAANLGGSPIVQAIGAAAAADIGLFAGKARLDRFINRT